MYLDVKALSRYLNIKPSTLYAWASHGKIPHVKIHGLLRFNKEVIDAWIDSFHKDKGPIPALRVTGKSQDIDRIIATATRAVYNARGETRPISSPGKEG